MFTLLILQNSMPKMKKKQQFSGISTEEMYYNFNLMDGARWN